MDKIDEGLSNDDVLRDFEHVFKTDDDTLSRMWIEKYHNQIRQALQSRKVDVECHRTVCNEKAAHQHKFNHHMYCDFCATEINRAMKRCGEQPCFDFTPPAGYKLVPIEPTEEMVSVGYGWKNTGNEDKDQKSMKRSAYKAMLSAAPNPSPVEPIEGLGEALDGTCHYHCPNCGEDFDWQSPVYKAAKRYARMVKQ